MKTITLKTSPDEIIAYDNIQIEVSESTIIPERTEVVRKIYTIGQVNSDIESIDSQISSLELQKSKLISLRKSLETEANKVTNSI
jgi:hypothetical protein